MPAYIFSIIEEWSYLDAIYFSVISLTKVGFGDYVPRTHPPDIYAKYTHKPNDCLKVVNSSLRNLEIYPYFQTL